MHQPTILLVIEGTYPWYRGGVSEWVHQYIKHCAEATFIILQVATDQYLNAELNEALYTIPGHVERFKRVPPPDLSKNWVRESKRWQEDIENDIIELAGKSDVVHVANTGFAGWIGKQLANRHELPLVLTEHALYWKEVEMGAVALECGYKIPEFEAQKKRMVQMFKHLSQEIYMASDKVISVSQCNIPSQQKMGAKKPEYIPNGVEKEWLTENKEINFNRLTIGWIGRCAEMKNPLKFFDVVDTFQNQPDIDCSFIMMACDANEPDLQEQLEAKLAYYPEIKFIWNESSKSYFPLMDALCITSHNESQPLVLFEALSQKVLPIGWEAGDVTSDFGIIVENSASAKTLASQVLDRWNQPQKWRAGVEELYSKVAQEHTWPKIFDEYKRLFAALTPEVSNA